MGCVMCAGPAPYVYLGSTQERVEAMWTVYILYVGVIDPN